MIGSYPDCQLSIIVVEWDLNRDRSHDVSNLLTDLEANISQPFRLALSHYLQRLQQTIMFALQTFTVLLAFLSFSVQASPLVQRDVIAPTILEPNSSSVWPIGTQQTVIWWVTSQPILKSWSAPAYSFLLGTPLTFHLFPKSQIQSDKSFLASMKVTVWTSISVSIFFFCGWHDPCHNCDEMLHTLLLLHVNRASEKNPFLLKSPHWSNFHSDHPLAQNFELTDGNVMITVPNVPPREDYLIVCKFLHPNSMLSLGAKTHVGLDFSIWRLWWYKPRFRHYPYLVSRFG